MATLPRMALIGCGNWGKNLARNFMSLGALSIICENDQDVHQALKEKFPTCQIVTSFGEVLQDDSIQGVAIATPAETHFALAREALLAGKDVLVEKPLCLAIEEGKQLVALAKEQDRILMVGHLLWYHPAVLQLKKLIDSGELGRIQYIYSHRLNLGRIRREENILWSFAPHDISVILGLLGEEPDYVQAQGGNYLHQQIADVTVSLLSFPSGVKAHIFVSWLHPFKEQKLIVVGDRKMAVFDDVQTTDKLMLYPHSIEWKNQAPVIHKAEGQSITMDIREALRDECEHFLHCMQTRQRPRTDGAEGLRVLSVLQKCQRALGVPYVEKPPHQSEIAYQIHDSAVIDEDVMIGKDTTIWHFSHVLKGSQIGDDCKIGQNVVIGPRTHIGNGVKIQNNVSVYEGVTLENHVFCGPSMVFTNVMNPRSEIPRMGELQSTRVKEGATLGANCTIVCGTTIGRFAFVGAGAVVLHDIPDYAMFVGNPARWVGWMCRCGVKLPPIEERLNCSTCGSWYSQSNGLLQEVHLEQSSPATQDYAFASSREAQAAFKNILGS